MPRRAPTSRGKGLFPETSAEPKTPAAAFRANIDGGSRGNPGPAAYGVVIRDGSGELVASLKKYIGRMSNNVAEYYGLIAALDYAQEHKIRALRVESDSLYKVKSADLQPLFERARKMSQGFESFRIDHVYREQNREADALANEALDVAEGVVTNAPRAKKAEAPAAKAEVVSAKPEPRKVQARFRSGVLYLLEDVELPDGMVVDVTIHVRPKPVA
jgi:ribonuclease HI